MNRIIFWLLLSCCFNSAIWAQKGSEEPTDPKATEVWEPIPKKVIPGNNGSAPSDAIILLDGSDLDQWTKRDRDERVGWILNSDGSMTVTPGTGDIESKETFGDIQLHLEWKSPVKIQGSGQHRGNSGVFLQKRYEVQILDNNNNSTYPNGQVGAIYKQSIPLAMASVKSGEWNAYDIIFRAPKFDNSGKKIRNATITVMHNGVLIQDHFEIKGTTEYIGWPKNKAHGPDAIMLQDHGSKVSYRNIWVRKLD